MAIHRHPSAVERHASASIGGGGSQSLGCDRRPSAVTRRDSRESFASPGLHTALPVIAPWRTPAPASGHDPLGQGPVLSGAAEGQGLTLTRPMIQAVGTGPQLRLSFDAPRSSPIMNHSPRGTCTGAGKLHS